VSEVVLDYQGIDISNVELKDSQGNFNQANYDTHFDANLGSAIKIYLTDSIHYI